MDASRISLLLAGVLVASTSGGRVTFHHNVYAHHATRCPRPGAYGEEPGLLLDFRDNVVYDWRWPAGYTAKDPAAKDTP